MTRSHVDKEQSTYSYNCVCGFLALLVDRPIERLPLRPRDGARVLDSLKHVHKVLCSSEEETVYIWREEGVEKQNRLKCRRCGLSVFYKHDGRPEVSFVLKGAVVRSSGRQEEASQCIVYSKGGSEKGRVVVVNEYTPDVDIDTLAYSYKRNFEIVSRLLSKRAKKENIIEGDGSAVSNKPQTKNRGTLMPK